MKEGTGVIFSKDQKNAKKPTAADLISFNMFNYKPDDSEGTHLARAAICKLFKIKKKRKFSKIIITHVFHYYNALWTDITKIAG